MTTNASRIRVTVEDALLAPEKPRRFLEKALKRGLTVWQSTNTSVTGSLGWTIECTDNPVDDWQLWLYFQPSARGGRLTITRYTPSVTSRSTTTKLTHQMAGVTIDDMGDALDRHHARQAPKNAGPSPATFASQRAAHAADLSAAVATRPAVQAVKETPAPQVDPDTQALAVAALGTLKANGKFALRMARNGRIFGNTTGAVRTALINRDLVHASGGMLTELGRTVRDLILNP